MNGEQIRSIKRLAAALQTHPLHLRRLCVQDAPVLKDFLHLTCPAMWNASTYMSTSEKKAGSRFKA